MFGKKVWNIIKYIIIPGLILVLFIALFNAIDYLAEGKVLESLDKIFTTDTYEFSDNGQLIKKHSLDWTTVKDAALRVIVVFGIIITIIVLFISDTRRRKLKLKDSELIAGYIDRFILNSEPLPADIPADYAKVFAKLSEIKYKEQKKEQDLLAETARKDDLVAYLAHDLKTPLTSVIGYLTLLRDEPNLSTEMRSRYTGIAVSKAERLEELVSELFEITRYNIHQIELEKGKVNLSVMLEQILFEFKPLLSEKKLSFSTEITPDINAYVDVDKIERVIDNLIRNAVHYSYEATVINVSLALAEKKSGDGKEIVLTVENSGKTIPGEKLERIFDRFYRVDPSRSSSTGGTGLGLAIAKQLVNAHDGSISAESENEKVRFIVRLPEVKN